MNIYIILLYIKNNIFRALWSILVDIISGMLMIDCKCYAKCDIIFQIFKTWNGPDINKYFVIVYTTEFYSVKITDR